MEFVCPNMYTMSCQGVNCEVRNVVFLDMETMSCQGVKSEISQIF